MFGDMWGDVAGGFLGTIGSIFSNKKKEKMAKQQMAFQERMSSTAHQREVKDLEAAGLNPILSAKYGGASSPGGAMPNIENPLAIASNSAKSLGDKVYTNKIQSATVDNMQLQNDLLKQQVKQIQISNARNGMLDPVYEGIGSLIDKGTGAVNDYLKENDLIDDVMKAGSHSRAISGSPNSAKSLIRIVSGEGSPAELYAKGKLSFKDSLLRASRGKLTEEKLRRYGLKPYKQRGRKH